MAKEKLRIPMPDERIIQSEVKQIAAMGFKKRESFPAYLVNLSKQIGLRNLLPIRMEELIILLLALGMLLFLSIHLTRLSSIRVEDLYACTFLVSPLLYMALSIYFFIQRIQASTFQVEMVCKYNLYQIAAFRMLALSVISILINIIFVLSLVMMNDDLNGYRAIMISLTSLFLFSVFFLYACMKKPSGVMASMVICCWAFINIGMGIGENKLYKEFLMNAPLFVYAIVFLLSAFLYLKFLGKLVHYTPAEGVS